MDGDRTFFETLHGFHCLAGYWVTFVYFIIHKECLFSQRMSVVYLIPANDSIRADQNIGIFKWMFSRKQVQNQWQIIPDLSGKVDHRDSDTVRELGVMGYWKEIKIHHSITPILHIRNSRETGLPKKRLNILRLRPI
jgi:hypothetical protein